MLSHRLGVVLLATAVLLVPLINCQLSKPIRTEADVDKQNNKYRSREANNNVIDSLFDEDQAHNDKCHVSADLLWTTEVGYSIYTTPLVSDLLSDGRKEIISGTYVRYVEVLEAADGHRVPGWPYAFPKSSFHASPLLYDINQDGQNEVVVTTGNGEIVFLNEQGLPMFGETLKVPPLSVHKGWYEGLEDKRTDSSMSLFGQDAGKEESEHKKGGQHGGQRRTLLSTSSSSTPAKSSDQPLPLALPMSPENSTEFVKFRDAYNWMNKEAQESLELFLPNSQLRDRLLPKEFDPLQSIHYWRYHNPKDFPRRPGMVEVDPHVLCTPVIADLDNDGHDEMIVAVSYYFDREFYSDPANFAKLNDDIDITKYVAGGLVVFDLHSRTIKWSVHLDLTTLYTTYRAYIYATPTVVDLTGDGNLNVIVGTSIGFIYAFDHTGKLLRNFPVEMDEIQGQLSVGDVNGDGKLDILAVDNNANLVVWDANGLETWETRLSGFPSQAPSIGDVDGDGILDIVVGTDEGHVWAVRGTDGKVLDGFPVKTGGKILASVLLLRMNDRNKGLHIIVPSFDGYVYLINGESGCGDRIDLGETSFSQVLTDDLTGNGKMDLLVSTMNGNVYAFSTQSKYHPLKTWTAQAQGRNGFTYREGFHGIYVLPSSRKNRDMAGFMMTLQFEVVDNRPQSDRERQYRVRVSIAGSQTLFEKNYTRPGIFQEQIPCPNQRRVATVLVEMTNEHGQYFSDSFPMSFNMHFYRTLKWFLVVPFVLMGLVLIMSKDPLDREIFLPQ